MSSLKVFVVAFAVLLITACVIIAAVWFCQMWFGMRKRAIAQVRGASGGAYESESMLKGIWHGLQQLSFCMAGVIVVFGLAFCTMLVGPFYWAWYHLRGKQVPLANYDFDSRV